MYQLYKIKHPEIFQGKIFQGKWKKNNYFEGWYYKLIDSTKEHALAIIPGVSINREDTHAFIQVLDMGNTVSYVRYDIADFQFSESKLEIMIGDNYFSRDRIRLDIIGEEIKLNGELMFNNIIELPKTFLRPGIMGPFSYLPFMECYHGIININHDINGYLNLSGNQVDFSNGYGYIEKDWGRSFPETWIWFQSNHFKTSDVTIMFSVAKIPFLGSAFTGFLSFLRLQEHTFVFATYTGAKIRKLICNSKGIEVIIEDFRFRMEMRATTSQGGEIKAPKNGLMNRNITESINAVVNVRFSKRTGSILYEGTGTNAGLEIVE